MQLAQDQMIQHKTRNLEDTDFANPNKLLTSTYFDIISDKTGDWTGYRYLSGGKPVAHSGAIASGAKSVVLKNGTMIHMSKGTTTTASGASCPGYYFTVDVNGKEEGPNIIGRDVFTFTIRNDGTTVVSAGTCSPPGSLTCVFTKVMNNGWKIPDTY